LLVSFEGMEALLAETWSADGTMPALAELTADGASGWMKSMIPVAVPPLWTSLAGGVTPATHGLYTYTRPRDDKPGERFYSSADRRSPALWDHLAAAGRTVGVFNWPLTYPAQTVPGFMLAGLDAPEPDEYLVVPPAALEVLEPFVDNPPAARSAEELAALLQRQLSAQRDLLFMFMEEEPVEVLMVNFNAADVINHFAWPRDAEAPEVAQSGGYVREVYAALDGVLADLREQLTDPGETTLLLVSGHGAGPQRGEVSLARVLQAAGYLSCEVPPGNWDLPRWPHPLGGALWSVGENSSPSRMWLAGAETIDAGESRAFPWGTTGFIQINQQGREPQGVVPPAEFESLRTEIIDFLLNLRDPLTEEPVIAGAVRGEEIYGEEAPGVPDLVAYGARHGYRVWAGWEAPAGGGVLPYEHERPWGVPSAGHRPWGMLLSAGPTVPDGIDVPPLAVEDLCPTALYLAGVPLPDGLEGSVDTRIWNTGTPPEYLGEVPPAPAEPLATPEEDRAALEARLKDLGYL
jgi:predicted AlkP superfamily phosphohydrolase/phosphomutase